MKSTKTTKKSENGYQTLRDYLNSTTSVASKTSNQSPIPLLLDHEACKIAYESDPTLLFSDIDVFKLINQADPNALFYGFNPNNSDECLKLAIEMANQVCLSKDCRVALAHLALVYFGGQA